MELNAEQLCVCERDLDDPVKVMAGAGTGKTRVLVARFINCVIRDRIPPDRILALTFTNKAAAEMKRRIFEEVKRLDNPDLLWSLYGAWIMNFHSFGRRILSENAPAFGIDPALEVADAVDAARIKRRLRRLFENGRLPGLPEEMPPGAPLGAANEMPAGAAGKTADGKANESPDDAPTPKELSSRFDKIIGIMNKGRSLLMRPEDLEAAVTAEDHEGYRAFVTSVAAVWHAYEEELRRRRLIDFDSMIELVARGFRDDPAVRAKYAGRFDLILVDEFQDTSDAQNELLRFLTGGDFRKVTVVGDEKQSIYRWRDARVENIRRFPGEPLVLTRNYRSTQGILDLAFHFICTDPYFEARREELELVADRGGGGPPVILFHPPEEKGKSLEMEARALAAWIVHLTGDGDVPGFPPLGRARGRRRTLQHEEIAVLLRTLRSDSGLDSYEQALDQAGIPYAVVGGANALEKVIHRKLLALLSVVLDPNDLASLVIILEGRPFSLDDAALNELFTAARGIAGPDATPTVDQLLSAGALAALSGESARERCARLGEFVDRLRRRQAELDLQAFLTELLEDGAFYLELFENRASEGQVLALSRELILLADGLKRRNEAGLSTLVEHLRRRLDDREFGNKTEALLPPGRVRIMTIHQAKGLEFPAVAVAGLRQPAIESSGFYVSRTRGLFLGDHGEWNRCYNGLEERDTERETLAQENRCLLYVAMTRAQDQLFVSSPHPEGRVDRGRPTLFADLLTCARERNLHVQELREPPGSTFWPSPGLERDPAAPNRPKTPQSPKTSPETILTALAKWRDARQAVESDRSRPPTGPTGLHFVTWRGLRCFNECPRQYYYRYLAGLGDELGMLVDDVEQSGGLGEGGENGRQTTGLGPAVDDFARYGTLIHRALERLMRRPPEGRTLTAARLEECYELAGLPATAGTRIRRLSKAGRAIQAFLESPAAEGDPILLEEPFYYRRDRLMFQGIFDRVDRSGAGYRIFDYKTGRPAEDHVFQIQFYAWALRKIKETDQVEGRLVYLKDGFTNVPVDVGPDCMALIEKAANRLEAAVQTGRFEAGTAETDPTAPCERCSFRAFCPAAAPKET